jgi:hypothetical protein
MPILPKSTVSYTVIGKKFADKNFRDNNIGGTKMTEFLPQKGILVPPTLFPPIFCPQIF